MTKTGSDMAYGDGYDRRENLRLIFRNGKCYWIGKGGGKVADNQKNSEERLCSV